jgi:acyl-[acyl-carrier-protein]-phospholipid O-acyltransferase / long-chain-fatty-acid--[acyl-carrier-protein] ligase
MHAAASRTDSAKGEAIVLFTTNGSLLREQMSIAAKNSGTPELAVPLDIRFLAAIPLVDERVRLKHAINGYFARSAQRF